MYTTKNIHAFNRKELAQNTTQQASWHHDYNDSSYIFIANLHYLMNEGDISTVFS